MPAKPVLQSEPFGVGSVVHLFKPVVAFVVTPIDKHGSVIDTRAILAPSFETDMVGWKGSDGRPLPREIALGPISAEDHGCATVAVAVTTGFVLLRIPDIKDSDGSYEVETRSADIDVCAFLNEPGDAVGGNKVMRGFWNAPSNVNRVSGIARWKRLSRSGAVVLEESFKNPVCTV